MNRIILIGNGFDLAHGMKTSYQNFLDDYWETEIESIKAIHSGVPFQNDEFKLERILGSFIAGNSYQHLEATLENFKTKIIYKNRFLKALTKKSSIENWVDVENEYYRLLIKSMNEETSKKENKNNSQKETKSESVEENYSVNELNTDFEK